MSLNLHFEPSTYYACTSCGKCCRSQFEIPLQPHKAKSVKESGRYRDLQREGYQPLRILGEKYHFLDYDKNGRCFFMEGEECGLHRDRGPHSKPVICQLYPFNLVTTADGVFVSLLFSCPAVLAGAGQPMFEQRTWLEQLHQAEEGRVPQLPQVKEHILVTQYRSVTWQAYLELEKSLLDSLAETSDPIGCLLGFVAELLTDQDRADLLVSMREEHLPLFATSILTYLEPSMEREDEAEEFLWQLREGVAPYSRRLGRPLESFRFLKPPNAFVRDAVSRYISNQLHGKLLLLGPSLVSRLLLLSVGLGILIYDLAAPHFDFDELEKAFDICEGRIVSQSSDFEDSLCELEDCLLEEAWSE